jgi:hypothetical protein
LITLIFDARHACARRDWHRVPSPARQQDSGRLDC